VHALTCPPGGGLNERTGGQGDIVDGNTVQHRGPVLERGVLPPSGKVRLSLKRGSPLSARFGSGCCLAGRCVERDDCGPATRRVRCAWLRERGPLPLSSLPRPLLSPGRTRLLLLALRDIADSHLL
jgi:hypothetical protein